MGSGAGHPLVPVLGGLPPPQVQHRVRDAHGFVLARVDLAYPQARLAIEYDGDTHFTPARSRADRRRDLLLADLGWHTMRLTYDDVDGTRPAPGAGSPPCSEPVRRCDLRRTGWRWPGGGTGRSGRRRRGTPR
jgi:hypothetical protein